jgi:hypothetical protein
MERLVINDSTTGYIHYTLDKKQTIPLALGPGLMDTEINYFVQYQKNNLSIALWVIQYLGLKLRGY